MSTLRVGSDATGGADTGRKPPVGADRLGSHFVQAVRDIPQVIAVGIEVQGKAYRIVTVLDRLDLDVMQQVYECELGLYDLAPDLEADFVVTDKSDPLAEVVLGARAQDYRWER